MNRSAKNDDMSDDIGSDLSNRRYAYYVLFMIFLVTMLSICDRTVIAVLVDDIKLDLDLNDRQMGFVMGLAFSMTYFAAGIPLARLSDRTSRTAVITGCITVWSIMTAWTGFASNYVQLVMARMGVGIGEAGAGPASQSLIADVFEPGLRARAMSVMTIGALVGGGLGIAVGGWSGTQFGWRATMIGLGLPGLVLAAVFYLTVKNPRRRIEPQNDDGVQRDTLLQALKGLARNRAFVYMTAGASLASLVGSGRSFWEPAFLRRVYDLSAQDAGFTYLLISVLPSVIGAFALATVLDRLGSKDKRWYGWLPAICISLVIPLSIIFYLSDPASKLFGFPIGYYFSALSSLFVAIWAPAAMTLGQTLVPGNMRSVSAAAWSLVSGLVGAGLGPLLVGDMNTRLEPVYGVDAIRYSLIMVTCIALISSVMFMMMVGKLDTVKTEQ